MTNSHMRIGHFSQRMWLISLPQHISIFEDDAMHTCCLYNTSPAYAVLPKHALHWGTTQRSPGSGGAAFCQAYFDLEISLFQHFSCIIMCQAVASRRGRLWLP